MLIRSLAAALWLCALLACASPEPVVPPPEPETAGVEALRPVPGGDDGRVFHPERGVVCDRARDICYSGGSPSAAATERYLGRAADCGERGAC